MGRYITLGADENGEVYGLKVNDDGTWRRNSLGLSTSCVVIRPVTKENYEYFTENPQSAKEVWQQAVQADQTEKGLDDWFEEIDTEELIDKSFVYELLEDDDNPTIRTWREWMDSPTFGKYKKTFREHVEQSLVESDTVDGVKTSDDAYEWEASGWFPPKKPFAVEFAPKKLLEEYYAHLRKTYKEFEG